MTEHKTFNWAKFSNMTKIDKIKALVDELNDMSEKEYLKQQKKIKESSYTYLSYPFSFHFYFLKSWGKESVTILRDVQDSKKFVEVAFLGEDESHVEKGFADLSAEKQKLIMSFIICLEE